MPRLAGRGIRRVVQLAAGVGAVAVGDEVLGELGLVVLDASAVDDTVDAVELLRAP